MDVVSYMILPTMTSLTGTNVKFNAYFTSQLFFLFTGIINTPHACKETEWRK